MKQFYRVRLRLRERTSENHMISENWLIENSFVIGVIHKRRPQEWGEEGLSKSGHQGRGSTSSKSGRPHLNLVRNLILSIYLLDHGENHYSKKYKYTVYTVIDDF